MDEVPIKKNNPIGNNDNNIENEEINIEANNNEDDIEENNEANIIANEENIENLNEEEANINNDDVQGNFDNINEDYDENLYDYDVTTTEQTTKSGRVSKAPNRLGFQQHNLLTQGHQTTEYNIETAKVIAKTMCYFNNLINNKNHSFLETFSLKRGLKHFGAKGYDAACGEIKQLHDRVACKPIHIKDLTQREKKRAMESLIFLVEKRDGRVKARACANGSTQRDYINKEDAASPTAAVESILLTATIDAK
jgi:hypothetical protein